MGSFETNVIFLNSLSIASLQLELYYSALEAKADRVAMRISLMGFMVLLSCTVDSHIPQLLSPTVA